MMNFDQRLETLDTSLFDDIDSQTTAEDKRSLLALQRAVRESARTFSYLEIGSYMGGEPPAVSA